MMDIRGCKGVMLTMTAILPWAATSGDAARA